MSNVIIRPAIPDDAPALNAYRRQSADEPNNQVTYSAGEYTRTVDQEQERIIRASTVDNQHMLVAEIDGEIVGHCVCAGRQALGALRHTAGLGIDVHMNHRGLGIGRALMQAMIAWARENPVIHRVELEVFTHNVRAIHLYLSLGFVVEGLQRQVYFKYGRFVDVYVMALLVGD
ncbi:MAG: GNAT family N-acetyltransferase [Anaerolineae bacterium]|nr:GNAT family N-acetyltransferase [Anaerolineae bacterium]